MSNTHVGQVLTSTTLTTTSETVACAIPAFATNNPPGTGVTLDGELVVTTGTGVTALVVKYYQAPASASVVVGSAKPASAVAVGNTQTLNAAASITGVAVPLDMEDTSAAALSSPSGIQYFVTVTQTGATGNGSVTSATLNANSAVGSE